MTPEERDYLNVLSRQIQDEIDPDKFMKLVDELNKLLSLKEQRLLSQLATPEGRSPDQT